MAPHATKYNVQQRCPTASMFDSKQMVVGLHVPQRACEKRQICKMELVLAKSPQGPAIPLRLRFLLLRFLDIRGYPGRLACLYQFCQLTRELW